METSPRSIYSIGGGSKRIFTGENWRGRRFVWKNIWRQRRARLIVAVNIYPEGNFLWPGEREREREKDGARARVGQKARLFELFLSYLRALTREHPFEVSLYYRVVVVISKRVKYNRGSNPLSKRGVTVFRVPSVLGSGKS